MNGWIWDKLNKLFFLEQFPIALVTVTVTAETGGQLESLWIMALVSSINIKLHRFNRFDFIYWQIFAIRFILNSNKTLCLARNFKDDLFVHCGALNVNSTLFCFSFSTFLQLQQWQRGKLINYTNYKNGKAVIVLFAPSQVTIVKNPSKATNSCTCLW